MTLRERIEQLAAQKVLTLPENFDRRGRFFSDEQLKAGEAFAPSPAGSATG